MSPTPTQRRMLELLADGRPHTRAELHRLLWDEQSSLGAVRRQLCEARKVVRAQGGEIICQLVNGYICYRHLRNVNSA